ncbi:inactive receptor kinase [Tripterygium wilfordii]|uniref:Inactive receptor kinase n=1 Tax=Tripterygium wilfordii TaxID=458696 RepID=A0A7J7CQ13_TRIWF|nr:probable inactive receptor kinase At5g67200 [Tripterygium wilfordii]KAF5736177.1 inactive receptor kinase [Tripterygium wilfordii]
MPQISPLLLLPLLFTLAAAAIFPFSPPNLLPYDAVSILSFKYQADLDNKLLYTLNERFDYCQWQGVKCAHGRVVRVVLSGYGIRGSFAPNTLSRLDQLRVLSLHNNSLSGPIPDLSTLVNLKSLFLSHNNFSGSFPLSVLVLHRLTTLDLSKNNLTGSIPVQLNALERLNLLKLEWNGFNGTVPPLNQTFLIIFNVSGNNLTGPIPVTPTLSRFDTSSFSWNPYLCGEIINKACESRFPFFDPSPNSTLPPGPLGQSAEAQGGIVVQTPPSPKRHRRTSLIIGFIVGVTAVIASVLCIFSLIKKQSKNRNHVDSKEIDSPSLEAGNTYPATVSIRSQTIEIGKESQPKASKIEVPEIRRSAKSGSLVFCAGESQPYSLELLMKASAELLGRGTIGTTYKAALDNQFILTVKRLDVNKTTITSNDMFDRHLEVVGRLRHPNLVPIRAYFQAKGERLIIYDYQPNGSLSSLIHGSRSTRAKPLHWTSCLKIAEDVIQGLTFIHQASRLVHGNLKSSNVLLGADFEACLSDYCLSIFADSWSSEDPDAAAYSAPETRKSSHQATPKSDVYAFGILLLELLTGKYPSRLPHLAPAEMQDWVRGIRDDDGGDNNQLGMLTDVACVCSLTSPEQRPAMWQVLKMIQEIKESVMIEENTSMA